MSMCGVATRLRNQPVWFLAQVVYLLDGRVTTCCCHLFLLMTTTTCSRNDACWTRFVFPRPVAGSNRSEMPRCYMVKKQINKYQGNAREFWDEETSSNSVVPPDSPTEACVAPPYYTPLTNQSSKFCLFSRCSILHTIDGLLQYAKCKITILIYFDN